jgi:hypothetical protein
MQTSEEENTAKAAMGQGDFRALMREKMCAAVRLTLMAVLDEELEEWVGAGRYERKATRRDHRIGRRLRDLGTSVGTIEDLVIPRTRGGFQTQLFEKYQRRQVELDQMIGDMFVQGVSQARVGTILETLNGVKPRGQPSVAKFVREQLDDLGIGVDVKAIVRNKETGKRLILPPSRHDPEAVIERAGPNMNGGQVDYPPFGCASIKGKPDSRTFEGRLLSGRSKPEGAKKKRPLVGPRKKVAPPNPTG